MTKAPSIPFNRPPAEGNEFKYLQTVLEARNFKGDGPFTARCHQWLEENLKAKKALLTHSCTAAMEMSAILADLGPGDEVIMPSFTFSSTANAIALRGATPVFVDLRPDTMNIDETVIEAAITAKTKAIFAVHYAGVSCEMDSIMAIAEKHGLLVFEDAAQGLMSSYKGRALGTIGALGSISFHDTKNIVAGEGGALLINDPKFSDRAEIIREKGTNRRQFLRGQVDKYTWVDIGSSFLPSEFNAAVLMAQFERAKEITAARLQVWNKYSEAFGSLEQKGLVRRPIVPSNCQHNGHIFYLIARNLDERSRLIEHLNKAGVGAVFHYIPLHTAPAGRKFGRPSGSLERTVEFSERLVRLPLWADLQAEQVDYIIETVHTFYRQNSI